MYVYVRARACIWYYVHSFAVAFCLCVCESVSVCARAHCVTLIEKNSVKSKSPEKAFILLSSLSSSKDCKVIKLNEVKLSPLY